jgi:cell division septation protein DedD
VNGSPVSKVTQPVFGNVPISGARKHKGQNQTEPSTPGFVLQVGSFQEFQRADDLKNKLINSDYSVFIASILEEEMGQTLHRVYVGTFLKKIDAEKAAVEIKESEKIESLVKYYKKS